MRTIKEANACVLRFSFMYYVYIFMVRSVRGLSVVITSQYY